ncbi:MAG: hypothetical protein JNN26_26965 [Candidatus Obscuribacter sp.]|nr:hypothetical protein [Candidatus Obscuribacter sp.]
MLMRVLASYSLRFFSSYMCMSTFIILPMGFVCPKEEEEEEEEGRKRASKKKKKKKKT